MSSVSLLASTVRASGWLGLRCFACRTLLDGTLPTLARSAYTSPADCARRNHSSLGTKEPAGTSAHAYVGSLTAGTRDTAQTHVGSVPADRLIWLPMPKLSHEMTHGRIAKWHVGDSDSGSGADPGRPTLVSEYDILLTVDTDSLVEEAYRLDQFAGTVSLLVESQEEVHVAGLLVAEGEEVEVGRPIAVLCEDPEDAAAVRAELLQDQHWQHQQEQHQQQQHQQQQQLEEERATAEQTRLTHSFAPTPVSRSPATTLAAATAVRGAGTERTGSWKRQVQGAGRLSQAGRALVGAVGNLYADLDAATRSAEGLVRSAPPPRLLEWQSYLASSPQPASSGKCGCM